jgi:hypothetical protein
MYALSLILFLSLLQQAPPTPSPSSTQKGGTEQSDNARSSVPQTSIKSAGSQASPASIKTDDDDKGYEKSLYHAYEWATIIGVLVALGGLFIIGIQTKHTARNADALLSSERAWIKVDIATFQIALSNYHPPPHLPFLWIRPVITNHGRTVARITRIYGRAHRLPKEDNNGIPGRPPELPQQPDYSEVSGSLSKRQTMLPPTHEIDWFVIYTPSDIEEIKSKNEFLYVYGYVDYDDVGGEHRQTRFCQLYWIPSMMYEATEEGFIESDIMPPAYTKST